MSVALFAIAVGAVFGVTAFAMVSIQQTWALWFMRVIVALIALFVSTAYFMLCNQLFNKMRDKNSIHSVSRS